MRLNVNPTRMELRRLRERLKTAEKGHKLLKDKSDELVRRFMAIIRDNKKLRKEIEHELAEALRSFMLARAATDEESIEQALFLPASSIRLECASKSIMGVEVPQLTPQKATAAEILPYALPSVTGELDVSIVKITRLTLRLIKLAEIEKSCNMLASEIEKTRRRVNALEYVVIPNYQETIKYIMMKLDETERSAQARLMKIK